RAAADPDRDEALRPARAGLARAEEVPGGTGRDRDQHRGRDPDRGHPGARPPVMRTALLAILATGCAAAYRGGARPLASADLRAPGWVAVADGPEIHQPRELDCGPAAAAMVLGFWGYRTDPDALRSASGTPISSGVQAGTLRDLLRLRGLEAFLVEGS